MDNYTKGKSVEEPLNRDSIPIPSLPNNFLWMQVKASSKVQRLLDHAHGAFKSGESTSVVWTGSGDALIRTIACAESMKRACKVPHQITKIGYRKCEDYWEPKLDGLDQLIVTREIPIIHILLSSDPIDTTEPGYQSLDCKSAFWKGDVAKPRSHKKPLKVTSEEIASMGLQSQGNRGKKNSNRPQKKK